MKKILFAIAIVLTIGMTASAQRGTDGLFNNFNNDNYNNRGVGTGNVDIIAPNHGFEGYAQGNGEEAPLGSGLLILTTLGAGYAVARKRS
jgi:hypothetical protein